MLKVTNLATEENFAVCPTTFSSENLY